jgi:ankyrin repeat protein
MPLNNLTRAGFSMLHLATFNNQLDVVRTIVEGYSQGRQNPFKEHIAVNLLTPDGDTELDLAVRGDHIEIARHLIRLGCHARR